MPTSDDTLPMLATEGGEVGAAEAAAISKADRRQLEGKAITGTIWTVGFYGASQAFRLGNSWALTHMLLPQYFGLMALISPLILGVRLLTDIGLLPAVIASPRGDEPVFLNTAWTIGIVRGFALWFIIMLLSIPAVQIYNHDTRLYALMAALGFGLVLDGFVSSNTMTAARHIGVRRIITIDLVQQVFALIVTVAWAYVWPSVWALVVGTLSASVFRVIVSHIPFVMPGIRNRFAWEKESIHSLIHFGKWIFFATAFYSLASQADRMLLGKYVSLATLGVYSIAFTFADIPRQVIQQFTNRVGLPFIAKLKDLPLQEWHTQCLRYRFYVLCAGAVILSTVINAGGPFLHFFYDKRYADAQWIVPVLALGLWHTLLYSTTGEMLIAQGKPKYGAVGTASYCVSMFTLIPIGFHFGGLFGAVIAVAAGDFPFYLVLSYGAQREKIGVWRQDLLATGIFLVFLAAGFFLKRMIA